MLMEGSASSNLRESVVLPAPDGDDSTSNNPRRAMLIWLFLLNVLNLFAELVDNGFQLKADGGEFLVG